MLSNTAAILFAAALAIAGTHAAPTYGANTEKGAAGATENAPTGCAASPPTQAGSGALTGITHAVSVGLGGLKFDPDNVVAEVGDVVQFHFLPMNHTVAQSSFDEPCKPLDAGFFAGFDFVTQQGENPEIFEIVIKDKKPIWYYCPQTKGNHCQAGMAGAINQNFDSPNVLSQYKKVAAGTGTSVVPPTVQGGKVKPNPFLAQ